MDADPTAHFRLDAGALSNRCPLDRAELVGRAPLLLALFGIQEESHILH